MPAASASDTEMQDNKLPFSETRNVDTRSASPPPLAAIGTNSSSSGPTKKAAGRRSLGGGDDDNNNNSSTSSDESSETESVFSASSPKNRSASPPKPPVVEPLFAIAGAAVSQVTTERHNGQKKSTLKVTIPHDSPFKNHWEVILFINILVLSIVVPLRIGFHLTGWRSWIAVDIINDLLLWVDIAFQLVTTYESSGGAVVNGQKKMATHYAKSIWFALDLISVLPGEIVMLSYGFYTPIYRCNRLVKFTKLIYFISTWDRIGAIKPTVMRIIKAVFAVGYLSHLSSCVFMLIVHIEHEDAIAEFTGAEGILEMTLSQQYLRAFYWSFVTLLGFTDTNPNTQLETILCIAVTMIGISLLAAVIGTVGSLVTGLDSSNLYFRQKLDRVEDYMDYKGIPKELRSRVRGFYDYLWKSGKGLDQNHVLDDLPPYLKNKISVVLNRESVSKVPLFRDCANDTVFISEIVKCLRPYMCLPNTFIVRRGEIGTEMYFISRGELNVVSDEGRVVFTLRDGGFFGEIALIYDTKRTATIVARTYCDLFRLTKEDFSRVMDKFPSQSENVRMIAKERFEKIVIEANNKEGMGVSSPR